MATLDNESLIQTLDTENMLQSIQDLPDQIDAAWFHSQAFSLPTHFIQATNVLILGMGASAIGGLIASSLAQKSSRKPIITCESAELPNFVDSHTLVIAVSYSGNSADVTKAFSDAGKLGAKIVGISTGGEIGAICRKYRAPHFIIQYGAQPRAAIGYLTIPVVAVLNRLNFLEIEKIDEVIGSVANTLRDSNTKLGPNVPTSQNRAKQLAESFLGSYPLLIGSTITLPVINRWQMQFEQNAHLMTATNLLPAGLYSTIEGLSFPANLSLQLRVIQIRSAWDDGLVASAHNVFHELVRKRRLSVDDILIPQSDNLLCEIFELLLLGDYVSYYLALLEGVDPSSTPNMIEVQQLRAAEGIAAP